MRSKLFLFSIGTALLVSSCFYQEGPVVSFLTKKQRITNKWQYQEAILNNLDITDRQGNLFMELDDDQNYTRQYIVTDTSTMQDVVVNEIGRWDFDPVSKAILNLRTVDTLTLEPGDASRWQILRLTEDELWLQLTTPDAIISYKMTPYGS